MNQDFNVSELRYKLVYEADIPQVSEDLLDLQCRGKVPSQQSARPRAEAGEDIEKPPEESAGEVGEKGAPPKSWKTVGVTTQQ